MSIRLLLEEETAQGDKLRRALRGAFLLVAISCFSYTGWIYLGEYWHQRSESEAFDKARREGQREPAEPFEARLSIPRLRMTTMVEEGVGEDVLKRAAGHVPNTALPGHPGNVALAAHRDTLFRPLKGIKNQDTITLSTRTRDYEYEVISTGIVSPDDVGVLTPTKGEKTLTLITCYPFYFVGNAPKRFIVRARETGETDLGATGPPPRRTATARKGGRQAWQAPIASSSLHRHSAN